MASKEFIQKRIQGKEKEIEKLEKKLARIKKVEAQNWEDPNPYFYTKYDLDRCIRDLKEAKEALAFYQQDLEIAIEKENSRNIEVILHFLNMWKHRNLVFFSKGLEETFKLHDELIELVSIEDKLPYGSEERKQAEENEKALRYEYFNRCKGYFEAKEVTDRHGRKWTQKVKVAEGDLEYCQMFHKKNLEESIAELQKYLNEEANRKYDFIIERTNHIVGEITDAAGLTIDPKGNLNGLIVGKKGTAKVQTIGAGGYNIQCFHFRTLINKA